MKNLTKYEYTDIEVPEELITKELSAVSPLVVKILYKRGFRTSEEISNMLFGNLKWSLSNYYMTDTDKAVAILEDAIKVGMQIVVYQDYDVDGCSAGALCLEALRAIGGKVESYVNDRDADGYGMCHNGIDSILEKYPETKVILTVDNGIAANRAIDYAKEKGLTVIVTDHHIPGDVLPDADAVIDPKRTDEFYPFHELCGAGVAFKLMLALYHAMNKDVSPVINTMDIVALATVADIVPLVGENRDLVREGLRIMNEGKRLAFRIMRELVNVHEINSHSTIAYHFAPMINSLSRMGKDSLIATETLISNNEMFVRRNVTEMIELNKERREESSREEAIAKEMIGEDNLPNVIVLASDVFKEGIIGIVAGRLKNTYHRPVIVFAPKEDGTLKGSCRSIDEFHLKNNFDKISDLLLSYGGHAKAAGVSIRVEGFDAFEMAIRELAKDLTPENFVFTHELDDVLDMDQATVEQIWDLKMLEPYGEGNPQVLFGLKYDYDRKFYFGKELNHVKYLNIAHNLTVLEWQGADRERARERCNRCRKKAIGTLELNEYDGSVSPQFVIAN